MNENSDLGDTLRELAPPLLMALGALSLLRTSRVLSLVALGIFAYDIAGRRDGELALRRLKSQRLDDTIADSFPASDPPSFSGASAGAP